MPVDHKFDDCSHFFHIFAPHLLYHILIKLVNYQLFAKKKKKGKKREANAQFIPHSVECMTTTNQKDDASNEHKQHKKRFKNI